MTMPPEPTWTHNGWCMFCPIKLANIESETKSTIAARWSILEPLLSMAIFVQGIVIGLCAHFIEGYEPHFYFKITGARHAGRSR